MGVIYGLYSTRDGVVRYVGQTEYTAKKRLDLIVTKALDQEAGKLYDWMRDEWRSNHEVRAYVLQDDVIPADLDMFERYWITQFYKLVNTETPVETNSTTAVGAQVNQAIRVLLKGESHSGSA